MGARGKNAERVYLSCLLELPINYPSYLIYIHIRAEGTAATLLHAHLLLGPGSTVWFIFSD